jgi:hypothetical protein
MGASWLGRLPLLCAAVMMSVGVSRPAPAQSPAAACIAAHADAQVERDSGRLLSAKAKFTECRVESCPELVRRECQLLLENLQAVVPSVVLVATDAAGRAQPGASATIDGRERVEVLDGRPLEIDPGQHRIEFALRDGRRQTVTVMVRETEQRRRVASAFAGSIADDAAAGPSPLAYVFGGLGVAALGSFVYFALDGNAKQSELESTCAPDCAHRRDEVDAMRSSHLIADISLGVSLASLGLGTYFFLRPSLAAPSGAANPGRGVQLDVAGRF